MKKIGRFFVLMMVALVSVAAFTACSDDDDDDAPKGDNKIVGLWQATHQKGWYKENGVKVEEYDEDFDSDELLTYEFTSAGKLIIIDYDDRSIVDYKLSGKKLTLMNLDSEYDETIDATVNKLNNDTLELEINVRWQEDGDDCEEHTVATFKRIR
ncbi:MAG: hypothetical protein HDS94_04190 [Bacteroidales bacterium]|nr:hypothetical protein [Bacteroidales bacterium]